jgi:hypothetical protein
MREKLPDTRPGTTQRFTIIYSEENDARELEVKKIKGYLVANVYPGTNRLGEIFVRSGKPGSSEAMFDEWAKLFCMLLQNHVPLDDILRQCEHTKFRPDGQVKGMAAYEIHSCSSLTDLIAKWLRAKKFDLSAVTKAEAAP